MSHREKTIDLVLSGGGARGLAHIGVIRELTARGYTIRSVTGTSIGALVGAMYVMGRLDAFATFMQQQTRESTFRWMDFTLSSHGLIRGKRLFAELQKLAPDCPIEQLSLPLTIVATDLLGGSEVVFRTGSVYAAVRASVAIPSVIMPVFRRRMMLVDGGVLNPFPLDRVPDRSGGALLVGVNLYGLQEVAMRPAPLRQDEGASGSFFHLLKQRLTTLKDWKSNLVNSIFSDTGSDLNYAGTFRRMSDLMTAKMALQTAQLHHPDVLVTLPMSVCGLFDFYLCDRLVQHGHQAAAAALEAYEKAPQPGWTARLKAFWRRRKS